MKSISGLAWLLVGTSMAYGSPVADFANDLQGGVPSGGWQYLWNANGPVGDPTNYIPLQSTPVPVYLYDDDGDGVLAATEAGRFAFIGEVIAGFGLTNEGQPGGHPGAGSAQDPGGIERYVIAAYTLDQSGPASITDSVLTNADVSSDGLSLAVFVNDEPTPRVSAFTAAGQSDATQFDVALGALAAGETIYVAVGSRGEDFGDTFSLAYTIRVVPEPATLAIFGLLSAALLRQRRSAARRSTF